MQYDSGTSSVQARMCSMSRAHFQCKRGCALLEGHITSTSEDMQYESGTSLVQARICSMNQAHH